MGLPTGQDAPTSQVFTIGKVDAGIAVLISDSVHLIEFPSLLLPAGVGPGSIVNISCTRNLSAEQATTSAFWDLQNEIYSEFGSVEPSPPKLRVRNTTQTSVTLEWDKLFLAQAKLLGLAIWRNGQRLTSIPNPLHNTSTKLSGLALDTDYSFHLVLKTSAGTYSSPVVKIRTHTIADTSGVAVCFGLVEPEGLLEEAKEALVKMKARSADKIQIDTTHFVATSSASVANPTGGPGVEYQKALQLSIPVVSPEWVIACAREQKMVPTANYYSVGTTNHAASLSSANLPSTATASKPLPTRRATATIEEEEPPVIPSAAPAPTIAPRGELAEEEPEAPTPEEVVLKTPKLGGEKAFESATAEDEEEEEEEAKGYEVSQEETKKEEVVEPVEEVTEEVKQPEAEVEEPEEEKPASVTVPSSLMTSESLEDVGL